MAKKLIEVNEARYVAEALFADIFFRMAVARTLESTSGFDLVECDECARFDGCKIREAMAITGNGYCCCGERKSK